MSIRRPAPESARNARAGRANLRVSHNFGSDSRPKGDRVSEGKSEATKAAPPPGRSLALPRVIDGLEIRLPSRLCSYACGFFGG